MGIRDTTMSNKNATKVSNFLERYEDSGKLQRQLPDGYDIEKVRRLMLHLMAASNKIQSCSTESIYLGILKSAHLDLSFDLGECHLVPYGREADFQIDYKGLIKLVKRSGEVKHLKADVVREGDRFEYRRAMSPQDRHLVHEPVPFSDGKIIGAYAIFDLAVGYSEFEVMGRHEIDKIRAKAASGSMMWKEFFEEGAKKAVIRRGIKTLELYPDDKRAIIEEAQSEFIGVAKVQSTSELNDKFAPKAIESKESAEMSLDEFGETLEVEATSDDEVVI